ncbi:inner centromere protein [Arctopsyche grandis]|uniref:inner centromere protein n=1 Tax=Arctopsyche grandis TaxID=121162 RepID=UPI00406D7A3C
MALPLRTLCSILNSPKELYSEIPSGLTKLLTDGDDACNQTNSQFEVELRFLRCERDRLLKQLESSKTVVNKRKLNNINENDDFQDFSSKKNRPSNENEEIVQNCTFKSVHNNSNTSTPNEKSVIDHVEMSLNTNYTTSQDESKRNMDIEKNSDECDNPILDDKLMPPPKMPTRKKRGPNAKKDAPQIIIDLDCTDSDNAKPSRKLRNTKSMKQNSIASILVLEESTRMSTRSTRNSSRQTSTMKIMDAMQPVKKDKKSKRKGKSKSDSNENITHSIDDLENHENTNMSHSNTVHIDNESEKVISVEKKRSFENCNLSKSEIDQKIVEKKISCEPLENINHRSEISNNEIMASAITSPKIFEENMLRDSVEIQCLPANIRNEVNVSMTSGEHPKKEIDSKKNKSSKKNLNETVVITALPEICNKSIDISNIKSSPAPIPCDTTITLVTKDGVKLAVNETVVISKDDQVLYNSSDSVLPDDFSEVEDTPSKNNPLKSTLNINKNMKMFESPVKKAVKHFEKLAEIGNKVSNAKVTNPTRIKTRGVIAKECNQDDADVQEPIGKNEGLHSSKNDIRLNKIGTPLDKKLNGKCNIPLSAGFKSMRSALKTSTSKSVEMLFSPNSASGAVHNNVVQTSANSVDTNDPYQKRNIQHQKREEQRKRREEKARAAALSREAQEKLKQAQIERLERDKEEKLRQFQVLREEEAKKKKLAQERKAAEVEERRKQEEAARRKARLIEKEEKRHQLAHQNNLESEKLPKFQKNKENIHIKELNAKTDLFDTFSSATKYQTPNNILKSIEIFNKMIQEDEDLETKNASDKEKKKAEEERKPLWAKRENFDILFKVQHYIKPSVIDKFYQTVEFVPNLVEIFPGIKHSKLQRNSSAVWRTPPRCSMMPNRD